MSTLSKPQKRLLIIVGSIVFLVLGFYLLLNYWANYRLPSILGDSVKSKNVDVSIIGNEILFDEPSVVIDSTDNSPGLMVDASARSIKIDNFSIWDLLFSQEIDVEDFVVDSLVVQVHLPNKKTAAQDSSQQKLNIFVKDIFTQIRVNHFELINSDFLVQNAAGTDTLYEVTRLNLVADGIVVDTATVDDPFPLNFDKSHITSHRLFLQLGKDYTLSGSNLLIHDTTFTIENLSLRPLYSQDEWVKRHKYEEIRMDISAERLEMKAFLWNIKKRTLEVKSSTAELDRLNIKLFMDKSPPQPPETSKPLLTTRIQQLPFVLTIDTVTFKDSYIEYVQEPVQYPRSGKVFFEDLYVTGYNLTNDTSRIKQNPTTTLDVFCQFMGQGELKTTIKLMLQSDSGEFAVDGRLGAMPVTYVNQVLVPLAGAEADGQVHEIIFNFSGNNYKSEGELKFHYEDLKVTLVDDQRDKRWLMSMIGNVAIRNNNTITQESDDYQVGEIYFIRYQNRAFWNYLWNCIRTGIMDVVVPFYSHPDKKHKKEDDPKYREDT